MLFTHFIINCKFVDFPFLFIISISHHLPPFHFPSPSLPSTLKKIIISTVLYFIIEAIRSKLALQLISTSNLPPSYKLVAESINEMQSNFYTGNFGFLGLGEPWKTTNRWQYAQVIESILNFADLEISRNSSNSLEVAHSLMDYIDLDTNLLNLILTNSMDDRGWFILAYINSYHVLGRKNDLLKARKLFDYIWSCAFDTLECNGK